MASIYKNLIVLFQMFNLQKAVNAFSRTAYRTTAYFSTSTAPIITKAEIGSDKTASVNAASAATSQHRSKS